MDTAHHSQTAPTETPALPDWLRRSEGFAEDLHGEADLVRGQIQAFEPASDGLGGSMRNLPLVLAVVLVSISAAPIWALAAGF